MIQLSHPYITTGKTIALTICTFVGRVMSLLFNMLSRFVTAFLPRSKHLLILWQQSPSTVISKPKKIKSVTVSSFSINLPWSDGTGCHDLSFWMLNFKPDFSLSSFTLIRRLFTFYHKGGVNCISEVIDISSANLDSSYDVLLSQIGTSLLFHVQF